jgi:hypothetical protein
MRRLGAGVTAVALLGAVVSVVGAGDVVVSDEPSGTKMRSGTTFSSGTDKAKSEDKAKTSDGKSGGAVSIERTAKELKRHENALLRRMQVCDRLRQIAQDTNDADLERQADELEDLARAAYQRHTERLGIGPVGEGAGAKNPDKGTTAPQAKPRAKREGEDKP